ncbi:MAG TPA: TolC family protein [Terriglobales bacterium]|nr:TolC family protein [Terriglobales bacterium]
MSLPGLNFACRLVAAMMLAGALAVSGWAQDSQSNPPASSATSQSAPVPTPQPQQFQVLDYSKPRSHFPNPIAPYTSQHVSPPILSNTPRIEQLLQDGKLMISMDDAVALALENNLDIGIARYNLNIADTDILRAKSGASILGVNAGIVTNTPGGGVGGLSGTVGSGAGGTSAGLGGAGAGLSGLVVSTLGFGPLITSFDPVLTGTLQWDHSNALSSNPFTGAALLTQNTNTYNVSYLQGFHSGTNLLIGFDNTRATTNSQFTTLSPLLNSGFRAQITQHLLQGLGFAPNDRFIRIAKNNREITDVAFRLQITTTVDQIENIYWDLVFAYENVRVQKESLAFVQKTLSDTQKQVQIGSLAPIEVVRAQSTVATDQQNLIQAQNNLQLQQLLMKNALSRTLVDPRLADAEVIPISTMQIPQQEEVVPTQDLVNDALSHRPELSEARINLTSTEISNKAVRSALLPTLDLFAYYGGSGLGGSQNPANLCINQQTPLTGCAGPPLTPPKLITPASPVGYGSTLNQLVNSSAPDKGIGLTLNVPIRNRAGQAAQVRSELEYRQAQMRLQQIENQVRIEVRNAQFQVQQNRASVAAAQAAVELGRQSLDAEQKKLNLGASTSTLVLQNQSAMATAESTMVSAMAAYQKSRIELDRATGLLLDHAGIIMADAERGQVTHMPTVPYVVPRQDVKSIEETPQQQAPPQK